jgi:hypothetical protein
VVYQLVPPNAAAERINYCRWLQQSVCVGVLDPDLVFYIDGACFRLSGYVNSQQSLLECGKSTLNSWGSLTWCENWGVICDGPVFFHETTNSERYVRLILTPFFRELTKEEQTLGAFHARRRRSAYLHSLDDWGKSSVRWSCGEYRVVACTVPRFKPV